MLNGIWVWINPQLLMLCCSMFPNLVVQCCSVTLCVLAGWHGLNGTGPTGSRPVPQRRFGWLEPIRAFHAVGRTPLWAAAAETWDPVPTSRRDTWPRHRKHGRLLRPMDKQAPLLQQFPSCWSRLCPHSRHITIKPMVSDLYPTSVSVSHGSAGEASDLTRDLHKAGPVLRHDGRDGHVPYGGFLHRSCQVPPRTWMPTRCSHGGHTNDAGIARWSRWSQQKYRIGYRRHGIRADVSLIFKRWNNGNTGKDLFKTMDVAVYFGQWFQTAKHQKVGIT